LRLFELLPAGTPYAKLGLCSLLKSKLNNVHAGLFEGREDDISTYNSHSFIQATITHRPFIFAQASMYQKNQNNL
jgi:hypothetical protein